jgi:hypothetical protein
MGMHSPILIDLIPGLSINRLDRQITNSPTGHAQLFRGDPRRTFQRERCASHARFAEQKARKLAEADGGRLSRRHACLIEVYLDSGASSRSTAKRSAGRAGSDVHATSLSFTLHAGIHPPRGGVTNRVAI